MQQFSDLTKSKFVCGGIDLGFQQKGKKQVLGLYSTGEKELSSENNKGFYAISNPRVIEVYY